jgi:hypothetical protein
MSKQDPKEEMHEQTITYVFVPDDGVYGTIISQGAWASMIKYYEDGIEYTVELANDEFIVIDEIGIGYEGESF